MLVEPDTKFFADLVSHFIANIEQFEIWFSAVPVPSVELDANLISFFRIHFSDRRENRVSVVIVMFAELCRLLPLFFELLMLESEFPQVSFDDFRYLDRLPKVGDRVVVDDVALTVLDMDAHRIARLRVAKVSAEEDFKDLSEAERHELQQELEADEGLLDEDGQGLKRD